MWKVIFAFLFTGIISAQEYLIVEEPIYRYMIDRFTNEIYYSTYFPNNNGIYRTDFEGNYHILTAFQSTPVFANNSHQGIIFEWEDSGHPYMFVYNFDNNEKTFLADMNTHSRGFSFSCDDSKFLISLEPIIYYSFEDSSIHESENLISSCNWSVDWCNDNDKVIYCNSQSIYTYSLGEEVYDTLLTLEGYRPIMGFSYNRSSHVLAYSHYDQEYISLVKLFDISSGTEEEIFNYIEDDPNSVGWNIENMRWSLDGKDLSFTANAATFAEDEIYLYKSSVDQCFRYTDDLTSYGYKYQLQWLTNDTIAYMNATIGRTLMGFYYDQPVSVRDEEIVLNEFSLSAYPNPFNPSTTIKFTIPSVEDAKFASTTTKLVVYDILGREVAVLVNEYQPAGNYEVEFNAKGLSSGVYYYRIESGNFSDTKKMIFLK